MLKFLVSEFRDLIVILVHAWMVFPNPVTYVYYRRKQLIVFCRGSYNTALDLFRG